MNERLFKVGDIVQHFKREKLKDPDNKYLYRIVAFANHSETNKYLVIYQSLEIPYFVWARPYEMFMSEVDHEKYPNIKQKYRFELYKGEM